MSMMLMVKAMNTKVGNPLRKLVLIKLADNANDQGECWPSHQHVADQCEISKTSVRNHIKKLEEMGLLRIEHRDGPKGNTSNLYHLTLQGMPANGIGIAGDGIGGIAGDDTRTSHSFEPVREPAKRFAPPTEDQVFEYMQERDFAHRKEAETFINFYESKGWLVGKSKMKDWKAAVRNWISRSNLPKTNKIQSPQQQDYDHEAAMQREIEEFRSMLNG